MKYQIEAPDTVPTSWVIVMLERTLLSIIPPHRNAPSDNPDANLASITGLGWRHQHRSFAGQEFHVSIRNDGHGKPVRFKIKEISQ